MTHTSNPIRQAVTAIMHKEYWQTHPGGDERLTCVMDSQQTPRTAYNYSVYSCWGGDLDHPTYRAWNAEADYLELVPYHGEPVCYSYRDIKPYVEHVWNQYKKVQHQGRMEI